MHLQIICIFQNKCYYNKYQRNVNGKIQKLIFMTIGKCRAPFNYVPEEGLEAIKKVLAENAAKGLN